MENSHGGFLSSGNLSKADLGIGPSGIVVRRVDGFSEQIARHWKDDHKLNIGTTPQQESLDGFKGHGLHSTRNLSWWYKPSGPFMTICLEFWFRDSDEQSTCILFGPQFHVHSFRLCRSNL